MLTPVRDLRLGDILALGVITSIERRWDGCVIHVAHPSGTDVVYALEPDARLDRQPLMRG